MKINNANKIKGFVPVLTMLYDDHKEHKQTFTPVLRDLYMDNSKEYKQTFFPVLTYLYSDNKTK
ncbi:hypothetical protein HDR59_02685 [bacterium]|nr:hypothetical protein [bacterium]